LSEPNDSNCFETDALKPSPIETSPMIAAIPIIIPSIVKAELIFLCLKLSKDILRLSLIN